MGWACERRLDYIDFRLTTASHVRRADLVRTFGVSVPQASSDLAHFLALHPGAMVYNKTAKRYAARPDYSTLRGLTDRVLAALRLLAAEGHPLGWH
jgi:hypothetical protein